jgi:thiol-disulfide isomerase/thioredoxin
MDRITNKALFYSLLLIVTYLLVGLILDGDHNKMVLFFQTINLVISYWCFKKVNINLCNFLIYLSPMLLLMLIPILIENSALHSVIYNYFLLTPAIALLGLVSIKYNYFIGIAITLILINWHWIYPNSNQFFKRKTHWDTHHSFPQISLFDNDSVRKSIEEDKLVVLDFYSSYCGYCFQKFPEFERLKRKYNSNSNVKFYAIHVAYNKDTFKNSVHLLDEYNYTFNKLYSQSIQEIKDSLNFDKFPQLFIVKNNKVVYQGQLETNPRIVIDNTDLLIKKYLD